MSLPSPLLQDLSFSPAGEQSLKASVGSCNVEIQFSPRQHIPPFSAELQAEVAGLLLPLLTIQGCCQVGCQTHHSTKLVQVILVLDVIMCTNKTIIIFLLYVYSFDVGPLKETWRVSWRNFKVLVMNNLLSLEHFVLIYFMISNYLLTGVYEHLFPSFAYDFFHVCLYF